MIVQIKDISNPSERLAAKIKDNWRRLTEDDVALYEKNPEQFFLKVQEKYGLLREEAEDRIRQIEEADTHWGSEAA